MTREIHVNHDGRSFDVLIFFDCKFFLTFLSVFCKMFLVGNVIRPFETLLSFRFMGSVSTEDRESDFLFHNTLPFLLYYL